MIDQDKLAKAIVDAFSKYAEELLMYTYPIKYDKNGNRCAFEQEEDSGDVGVNVADMLALATKHGYNLTEEVIHLEKHAS